MESLNIISGDRPPNGPRYDARMVAPMREELVRLGFIETRTAAEVDAQLQERTGTALVVVNSVCGCAAGRARPALALALHEAPVRPDKLLTVFAGNDVEATARVREHFVGYGPSSPQMGLIKDGELVFMLERRDIEGRDAPEIAADLAAAFQKWCGAKWWTVAD
jgi:putative YphP/YqiW family bacilliredoxin